MIAQFLRSRSFSFLALIGVMAIGCQNSHATNGSSAAELPDECASFIVAYERCLSKTDSPDLAVTNARVEQTRLALRDEVERDPSGTERVLKKCVDARQRLSTTCR